MANVLVINIKKEHEPLLSFLYPTYSILDEGAACTCKFIIHKTVTSKAQRDALDCYYNDCIFISSQIFDEVWDESVLKAKVIEYGRTRLRNRKTKLDPSSDSFVEDCVNFMFDTVTDEEESSINELFDSFGSTSFIQKFMVLTDTIPVQKLQAALNTFVTKVLTVNESSSVYYKKKALVLAPKIRANLLRATDEFLLRDLDSQGLSICKFYSDLFV